MFTAEQLREVMHKREFCDDYSLIKQVLVNARLKQQVMVFKETETELLRFIEAVLSSASSWGEEDRLDVCAQAGEIAEALSATVDEMSGKDLKFKASLLYELAGMPALSSAVSVGSSVSGVVSSFFERKEGFESLSTEIDGPRELNANEKTFAELAFVDDSNVYSKVLHGNGAIESNIAEVTTAAAEIAKHYDLGFSSTELAAFAEVIKSRYKRATINSVSDDLFPSLIKMGFPAELLPAQQAAVSGGLLDSRYPGWGFASPTGSGKTFITRLLIADLILNHSDGKVVYVVPSKALVAEVASSLSTALATMGCKVISLSAQLVDLDEMERSEVDDASVIVMTPEKADMLVRLGVEFMDNVKLVLIDEAHHIESGTRGVLLEFYLWRLKKILPETCRYVFLSAVAPNIKEIVSWIDQRSEAVTFLPRPTRMRVGVYSLNGSGKSARGVIKYVDGTSVEVVSKGAETGIRKGICEVAEFLQPAGPVLIVAKGKRECENIAESLKDRLISNEGAELTDSEKLTDIYAILDSCLEREMYTDVLLRDFIKYRIAYHHAGLPPNVRSAVEAAIRNRLIDYVVATTTLAEGVNFPFSSVIVQSLALREPPQEGRPSRYSPITPRSFWNIAGRAGRPGYDSEGQVILFEPSLGLDKISGVIDAYISPDLNTLSPVKSALATALEDIFQELKNKEYSSSELASVKLPKEMSKKSKGAVNLIRVGLMHAYAEGIADSPEEILESTFAKHFLRDDLLSFAKKVFQQQDSVIAEYLEENDSMDLKSVSELGLSLETLTELRDYVRQMKDWQIESCEKLFYGAALNLDQVQYLIGPVAKRMSELEGPSLGGFLSDVIVKWLSGATFTHIKASASFSNRLEDLIAMIYSRVQFLLPWGLWATDWLIEQEAKKRNINYDNHLKKVAYLADAGVPNFDALYLHSIGFERVDSSRLSKEYLRKGGSAIGVDCIGWILSQNREYLERILRGVDGRRIEFNFFERLDKIRGT